MNLRRWLSPGMGIRRWLSPGMGIRRWLFVIFAGLLLLALGVAHVIRQMTRDLQPGGPAQLLVDFVTLQFLPYELRGLTVGVLGVTLAIVGSVRIIRVLMDPFRPTDGDQPLVEVIYQKRFLARGPRVVAIGGGTGLSTLLRGLKEVTSNLTAVVTVADDGGSSGVLRSELGIPPVGDIRNCIAALADAEPLMSELLQYRFPDPDGEPISAGELEADHGVRPERGGLTGHAVGNLIIAALTAIEDGDFEEGVRQMNRVLAVRGQVLPVTPTPLVLHARLEDGSEVAGQSLIARAEGIERVWIAPSDVVASDDALAAIANAELIVLGPGSLYTSLLPSLLVPAVRDAVIASPAVRVYVCNVATQRGETQGYDLAAHLDALTAHAGTGIVDAVLANNDFNARVPSDWRDEAVRLRWPPSGTDVPRLILDDLVDPENAHHHDPVRLASSLLRLLGGERARRRAAVARSA
jgi:uncharacterized cofD-like protein